MSTRAVLVLRLLNCLALVQFVMTGLAGPLFAQLEGHRPEIVSPGSRTAVLPVTGACPTFLWSGVEGVHAYELRVVEDVLEEGNREEREPVLRIEVPGNASGWTPSAERCLEPGTSYSWHVRGHGAASSTEWSFGGRFEISREPSLGEVMGALDVLRRYLERGGGEGPRGQTTGVSAVETTESADRTEKTRGAVAALLQVEGLASFVSLDVTGDASIGDDIAVTDHPSAGRATVANNIVSTNGDILVSGPDKKSGFAHNAIKQIDVGTNTAKLSLEGDFFPDELGWLELHRLSFNDIDHRGDTVTKSGGGEGRLVINSLTSFDVDNNVHICAGGGVVVGFQFKEQPTDQIAFNLICTH